MFTRENATEATGVEAASTTAAHTSTNELQTPGIAQFLQDTFGQKLTAYIAGIADPKHVRNWCTGQSTPRFDSELRLRAAFQVFQVIARAENPHTARAWMIGMNPQLEDDSPLEVIAEGRVKDAMAAARSYIKGDL
ncbi:XRE family transcriptional regulator [Streptomyces paludis]|uniref:XRE family transcriptional regulator n=1 Tax=Streptomyces paludis TaxID=2282738 RepID=A0A345HSQ5_9ACTN|nr:XRE family transcriptional regulator [Streptomyces paludis]AXG79729.1 XRE family transcriptional regulator [Streptomyces paludis]